ncbi:MAG: thiamine pyrophosphate-binding protein [Halanaeroarchaeum sp.]
MTQTTGAELFVEALSTYGVSHVFGNPGTTELPVVRALAESDLEYVLGLHEDVAVGMAAGYASTRRYHADGDDGVLPLGVANLHVTPGVAHGLGNLYNASVTGAPLLVTAGNHGRGFRHEEPILSGDLEAMTDQFTKDSAEVLDVEAIPTMVRRAVRVALTPPTGPVFLALPLDVAMATTDASVEPLGEIPRPGRADPDATVRAADRIATAEEPVLVLGDGVARSGRDAVAAAVDFAEAAGARVHGEILSSEVDFPGDHEQWVSHLPPREDIVRTLLDADLIVHAGTSTHTTLTAHEDALQNPAADVIAINDDAWQLGKNVPTDVSLLGDPGAVLADLADLVAERVSDEQRAERFDRVATVREQVAAVMAPGGETDDPRASKHRLVEAIEAAAPDAFVVDEGITSKYVLLSQWDLAPEQYVSNKGGGLGYGLPAALGAALAEGQREDPRDVIGFVGDGSYLYYPNAMYTAARYDLDVTVVVPDNRNYRILKDNAASLFDEPADDVDLAGVDFEPPVDIPANAESHGATGELIDDPDAIEDAVGSAVERDGPAVLDVLVHD